MMARPFHKQASGAVSHLLQRIGALLGLWLAGIGSAGEKEEDGCHGEGVPRLRVHVYPRPMYGLVLLRWRDREERTEDGRPFSSENTRSIVSCRSFSTVTLD